MLPYGPAPELYQDMVVADLLTRETKVWNIDAINKVFPELVEIITLLKPSITGGSDGVAWLGSRTGQYTTRSGYFAAVEHEQNKVRGASIPDWKKLIWSGLTSLKIKLFLWKATQCALPTGSNLFHRGLLHNTTCARCGEVDTEAHLFLHCEYARKVWSSLLFKTQFDPSSLTFFLDALKLGKVATVLPPLGVVSDLVPWICWFIWIARNQLVFEKRFITLESTVSKAIWRAREWKAAQPTVMAQPQRLSKPLVLPDLEDLIGCYSDAAWRKDSNMAVFRCIFKNKQGIVICQGSR